jgi:hypothetical protein
MHQFYVTGSQWSLLFTADRNDKDSGIILQSECNNYIIEQTPHARVAWSAAAGRSLPRLRLQLRLRLRLQLRLRLRLRLQLRIRLRLRPRRSTRAAAVSVLVPRREDAGARALVRRVALHPLQRRRAQAHRRVHRLVPGRAQLRSVRATPLCAQWCSTEGGLVRGGDASRERRHRPRRRVPARRAHMLQWAGGRGSLRRASLACDGRAPVGPARVPLEQPSHLRTAPNASESTVWVRPQAASSQLLSFESLISAVDVRQLVEGIHIQTLDGGS